MKTPGAMSSPREEKRMQGAAALWSWDGGSQPPTRSQQEEAEPCHFQKDGDESGGEPGQQAGLGSLGLQRFLSVSWHGWGLMPAALGCPVPQRWSNRTLQKPRPSVCPVRCHRPWQRRPTVSLYYNSAKRAGMPKGQGGCPCWGQLSSPSSALSAEHRELSRHIYLELPPVSLEPLTRG